MLRIGMAPYLLESDVDRAIAPPLDDSLAAMYAGRKLLTQGWGYWAEQIGKLEKFGEA